MKKIISSFFLFLSIFSFSILNVSADNIDCSKVSSVTVHYRYDDVMISNTEVSLYYLASIDAGSKYQFQDKYLDISFDLSDMTVSDISLKAQDVYSYISSNQLQADFTLMTKDDGTGYFHDLVPGLYLVSIDSQVIGEYRYYANPILLTIPTLENDTYQYDVSVNIKTEREKIEQEVTPPGTSGNGERVPNTLDNIYFYVGLLIVSILVIFGVMIYILKRIGENKSESKK